MNLRGIAVGCARRAAADQRERGYRAERGERGGGQERQPEAGGQGGGGGRARGQGSGGLRGGDGGGDGQPERAADLLELLISPLASPASRGAVPVIEPMVSATKARPRPAPMSSEGPRMPAVNDEVSVTWASQASPAANRTSPATRAGLSPARETRREARAAAAMMVTASGSWLSPACRAL